MQFIPSHMPSVNGQFEHEDVSQGASSDYIMKALMPIQSTNESKLVITAKKNCVNITKYIQVFS